MEIYTEERRDSRSITVPSFHSVEATKFHRRVIPNITAMAKNHWHHRHKSKSLTIKDMRFTDDNYI